MPHDLNTSTSCAPAENQRWLPIVDWSGHGTHPSIKPCRKCGASERYDSGDCKPCARLYALAYQKANIEKRSAYKLQWAVMNRRKDPDAARAKERVRRLRRRDACSAYNKSYYLAHPEYWQQWAEKNRSSRRAAYKRWREANPEAAKAAAQKWRVANPERVKAYFQRYRARKAKAVGTHTTEQGTQRFLFYGGICWICRRRPGSQLDHVIALCNGGADWPSNLRPACAKCNGAKGKWEMAGKKSVAEIMAWASPRAASIRNPSI